MSEKKNNFLKQHIQFINESNLNFIDISSELYREYYDKNELVLRIDWPQKLAVSTSGGHRLFDHEGDCYYVDNDSWTHIKWSPKEGEPHFVK